MTFQSGNKLRKNRSFGNIAFLPAVLEAIGGKCLAKESIVIQIPQTSETFANRILLRFSLLPLSS